MLGDWFSSLGKKLASDDTPDEQQQSKQPPKAASKDSISDLFSQLQQEKKDGSATSDPFAYFESQSPERQPPHVSKQKPTLSTFEPVVEADSDKMSSLSLFQNDRSNQMINKAVQETTTTIATAEMPMKTGSNMWADQDSDLTDDDNVAIPAMPEEKKVPASNTQTPASASPQQPERKRDYLSSWVSRAGTMIKKGAETVATTAGDAVAAGTATNDVSSSGDHTRVMNVLGIQNKQLKDQLQKQMQRVEDLQEEIEVHQSLEEEAHEANEELLFKVKYLQELARENGNDLTLLKRAEELGQEKKSLQRQVTAHEREIRMLEHIKLGKDSEASSEEEARQMLEDPKKVLQDLKSLYEHNRIQFSRSDEARVITAIYTQDKPVIRLYREMLFRRIAQKALEAAESLFKQTNSVNRNGEQTFKLLLDNRRIQAQNEDLKNKLAASQSETKTQGDQWMDERVRWRHKLSCVSDKAQNLAGELTGVRKMMTTVVDQVNRTQLSIDDDEVVELSEQKFSSYLEYFMGEQRQQIETVHQKLIDQCKVTRQEQEKAQDNETHGREVFEQLCQVQSEKASIQEDLGEAKEAISHLEHELNRAHDELDQHQAASNTTQNALQFKIDSLKQSLLEAEQIPEPVAIEAAPATVPSQSSPETKLQISELEKMLEEREEEIIELMQEVNNLQSEKQQSPEVVNTLQILKGKLKNSQQRFHGHHLATDIKKQSSQDSQQNSQQHVPILIVDEAGEKSSQSSRHDQSPPVVEVQVEEHKTDDLYQNVRARLEEVRQERLEQQQQQSQQQAQQPESLSPDVREPFSRILKNGKDSNFFSSLVMDNSGDKQQAQLNHGSKPVDDLFGFLMEPSTQAVTAKPDTLNLGGDNWGEAFGFPISKQQQERGNGASNVLNLGLRLHPMQEQKKDLGWGNENEDDIELDQEGSDNGRQDQGDESNEQMPSDFAIISQPDDRGEIMLQESLENSPIRTKRSTEVDTMDQQLGSKDGSLDDQNPIFVTDNLNLKLNECQNLSNDDDEDNDNLSENQDYVVKQMDSYHKRSGRLPNDNEPEQYVPQSLESSIENDEDNNLHSLSESVVEQHLAQQNESIEVCHESYMAAIESMHEKRNNGRRPSQDISNEVFERLMQGEEVSRTSSTDSMLHGNSPFNNSFTRQEIEMVMQTMRKNSLEVTPSCSPLMLEEKKVNISNLSDLVPEDTTSEKLNDTETEDIYTRMMRPGELNEVTEVEEADEDISDDAMLSPQQEEYRPIQIQAKAQHQPPIVPMLQIHSFMEEPPSMDQSSQFEPGQQDDSQEVDESKDHSDKKENGERDSDQDSEGKELIAHEVLPKSLQLQIQTSDSHEDHSEKRACSARSHHRRQESIDENPFMTMNMQSTTPRPGYENLADFTKDNIISYEADGKTISAMEEFHQENTCGFDSVNNEQDLNYLDRPDEIEEEDDRPREVTNVNGSAFFSRDFRVLKNATYGHQANQGDMILQRLQEEHGELDTSKERMERDFEQNEQSFAHPPPEVNNMSRSIQSMNNQELQDGMEGGFEMNIMYQEGSMIERNSIENSLDNKQLDSFDRGQFTIIDSQRIQKFLGSMNIEQQFSIDDSGMNQFEGEQEGTEDGIPQVDEYIEQNSGTMPMSPPSEKNQIGEIQLETVNCLAEEVDDGSLENISVTPSVDVSPAKTWRQNIVDLQVDDIAGIGGQDLEEEKLAIIQSNQQDDQQENMSNGQEAGGQGAGWEGDESLEEIQSFEGDAEQNINEDDVGSLKDDDQQAELDSQEEQLNRSVSGNEQVSDAYETTPEPPTQSQPNHQRHDTPIPPLKNKDNMQEESSNQQDGVRGWDEDSAEISIDDDMNGSQNSAAEAEHVPNNEENKVEVVEEQSQLAPLTKACSEKDSPSKFDLSMTTQAEVGDSDKFNCPNGHKLTIIDGKQHPLPSQECSATCGMANRQNSFNWLRCRECFYKVCHDCFHCASGHEMQSVGVKVAAVSPEACCQSCGMLFDSRVWMCELRAKSLQSPSQSQQMVGCADNSLICQECLGLGNSFIQASPEEDDDKLSIDDPELSEEEWGAAKPAEDEQYPVSAAKNEQVEALNSFDQMFASQKPAEPLAASDDPFSMLLSGNSALAQLDEGLFSTVAAASPAPETTTEVGGTGGGWGDDEDDLDIE